MSNPDNAKMIKSPNQPNCKWMKHRRGLPKHVILVSYCSRVSHWRKGKSCCHLTIKRSLNHILMLPVRRDDHEPQAAQERTLTIKRQKDCALEILQCWVIPTNSLPAMPHQTFAVPSLRFHRLTKAGWPQVWEAYPSSPYPLALLLVPDWPPEREERGVSPEHPDYAGSRSPEGRSGIEREDIWRHHDGCYSTHFYRNAVCQRRLHKNSPHTVFTLFPFCL